LGYKAKNRFIFARAFVKSIWSFNFMREFLSQMIGKKIDVVCTGGVAVRGTTVELTSEILQLKDDEDKICWVALDKIVVVWESKDKTASRTGFVSNFVRS
jgi:hypothetical protein